VKPKIKDAGPGEESGAISEGPRLDDEQDLCVVKVAGEALA